MRRANRLTESGDFKYLLSKGKRISSPYFSIYWIQGTRLRVGIVISKKVAKRAVVRNLIKRRIKHVFATCPETNVKASIVVLVKPPIVGVDYQTIKEHLLQKTKLINVAPTCASEIKIGKGVAQ